MCCVAAEWRGQGHGTALIRAFVDEPEIGKLEQGQLVEVTWDALPGRVWKGTLETLPTTVVQHGTRMVGEVTCVIQNEDLKLLPKKPDLTPYIDESYLPKK